MKETSYEHNCLRKDCVRKRHLDLHHHDYEIEEAERKPRFWVTLRTPITFSEIFQLVSQKCTHLERLMPFPVMCEQPCFPSPDYISCLGMPPERLGLHLTLRAVPCSYSMSVCSSSNSRVECTRCGSNGLFSSSI